MPFLNISYFVFHTMFDIILIYIALHWLVYVIVTLLLKPASFIYLKKIKPLSLYHIHDESFPFPQVIFVDYTFFFRELKKKITFDSHYWKMCINKILYIKKWVKLSYWKLLADVWLKIIFLILLFTSFYCFRLFRFFFCLTFGELLC